MTRFAWMVLCALLVSGVSLAQSSDRVEIFGGYSYVNPDFSFVHAGGTNGWEASAEFKVHRTVGLVADVSGYYPSLGISGGGRGTPITDTFTQKSYLFLFGPQVSLRLHRVTPFAHILFGAAHIGSQEDNGMVISVPNPLKSTTAFSYALGGGVDFSLTRLFALRGQVDWLHTGFSSSDDQIHLVGNSARISTGVFLRF